MEDFGSIKADSKIIEFDETAIGTQNFRIEKIGNKIDCK